MLEIPPLHAATEIRGGRHVERVIAAAAAGEALAPEELSEHFVTTDDPRSLAMAHTTQQMIRPQVGAFTVRGYYNFESGAVAVLDGEEAVWQAVLFLDAEDDRILGGTPTIWSPAITLRAATVDDAAKLAEVNQLSPILMDGEATVYDTDDIFAAERLMDGSRPFIAERDGEVLGFSAGVGVPMQIGAEAGIINYIHRTRVAPAGRGLGVQGALVWAALVSTPPGFAGGYAMVHRSNESMLRLYPKTLVTPAEPERLSFDVRALAVRGDAVDVRPASADDAARVTQLINGTHSVEQQFQPYTEASLSERLTRDRDLYSWPQLHLTDRAVVGVWSNAYRVHRTAEGETTEDQRALILDSGFEVGAEDEFLALLGSVCVELAEQGDTEITLLTSPGAPGYDLLRPLATRVDQYAQLAGGMIFAGLEPGPVYFDQLSF